MGVAHEDTQSCIYLSQPINGRGFLYDYIQSLVRYMCKAFKTKEVAEEPYFYVQIKREGKLFVDLKLQIRTSGLKNCTILPRKFYPLYSTHSSMYFSAFSLQLFHMVETRSIRINDLF